VAAIQATLEQTDRCSAPIQMAISLAENGCSRISLDESESLSAIAKLSCANSIPKVLGMFGSSGACGTDLARIKKETDVRVALLVACASNLTFV
jgi:hypothetical protein